MKFIILLITLLTISACQNNETAAPEEENNVRDFSSCNIVLPQGSHSAICNKVYSNGNYYYKPYSAVTELPLGGDGFYDLSSCKIATSNKTMFVCNRVYSNGNYQYKPYSVLNSKALAGDGFYDLDSCMKSVSSNFLMDSFQRNSAACPVYPAAGQKQTVCNRTYISGNYYYRHHILRTGQPVEGDGFTDLDTCIEASSTSFLFVCNKTYISGNYRYRPTSVLTGKAVSGDGYSDLDTCLEAVSDK